MYNEKFDQGITLNLCVISCFLLLLCKILCMHTTTAVDVMDARLIGSTFLTIDKIGFKQCGKECIKQSACKSINYKKINYTCELNESDKLTSAEALIDDPNYRYSDTTDWSDLIINSCIKNNCEIPTRCTEITDGGTQCVNTICSAPSNTPRKNVMLSSSTGGNTVYQCKDGYIGRGDNTTSCLANGTWTKLNLVCYARSDDWILVFRAKSGLGIRVIDVWNYTGVGHETNDAVETGCTSVLYNQPCSSHYRSFLLDEWSVLDITDVKVAMFKDGIEVAYLVFDGTDSTTHSWFCKDRIKSSSYADINHEQTYLYFTLTGYVDAVVYRTFYISHHHQTCSTDVSWFMVGEKYGACNYEHFQFPFFLYAPGTKKVKFTDAATADVFTIYVKINNFT